MSLTRRDRRAQIATGSQCAPVTVVCGLLVRCLRLLGGYWPSGSLQRVGSSATEGRLRTLRVFAFWRSRLILSHQCGLFGAVYRTDVATLRLRLMWALDGSSWLTLPGLIGFTGTSGTRQVSPVSYRRCRSRWVFCATVVSAGIMVGD